MFRHIEKIPYAFEAAGARQFQSDIRERNRNDRIDFDLAFLHAIPLTNGYAGPMPDANAAGDTAGTDSIAQILYEQHLASLNAEA
jgi:hypothetical protein